MEDYFMIILETKGLSKKFGGRVALQDVNLSLDCFLGTERGQTLSRAVTI